MGTIINPTSPWTFYGPVADAGGKTISATVTFSGAWTGSNALTGGTFHRDAGCQYTKIVIGTINPDGSFPAGTKVVDVSGVSGDRAFTAAQLASVGLSTVADIQSAPQITATS